MRAPARALSPLEVAVGGGGGALARSQLIWVHAQAHRAAGGTPLRTKLSEDFVEAFLLRLGFNHGGRRHDHHPRIGSDGAPLDHVGRSAQVFDAGIGTGTDEDGIDLDIAQRSIWLQVHILQSLFHSGLFIIVTTIFRIRDLLP